MFNFFKKKSEIEVLTDQYKKLLEEAYKISKTSREESDKKYAEADALMDKIQSLQK